MILINKKVGETPLELLDRLRKEELDLKNEKLSYAGRLDPMAEGEMLILVGDEENKNYESYLGFDKEYIATFLLGIKTDTGDALGLITGLSDEDFSEKEVRENIQNFLNIKEQIYPWFSAKTVNGIKLFDHYKKGNPDNIKRPKRNVNIKEVEVLNFKKESIGNIQDYIKSFIMKVKGDFRQEEILEKWSEYFYNKNSDDVLYSVEVKIKVSSGTYIRGLTENISTPGGSALLLKLNRTKIFI